MKKVLLATTILAASAGFAAADVTVTGTARMGVIYDGAKTDNELSFTNRVRIIFTASGETDGGLSFGASVRADNADEANDNGSTGTVFISGAFGTVTMGDVDNAFAALFGDLSGVGLTGLGDLNELASSADGGAFGVPGTTGPLGFAPTLAYDDLFEFNAAAGAYRSDFDTVDGAFGLFGFVWGPLFNGDAASDFLFAGVNPPVDLTNPNAIGAFGPGGGGIASGPILTQDEFEAALVAGLTPAANSPILTGLAPFTADGRYVAGNVFGQSYVDADDRADFLAGADTEIGAGTNDRDILLDTSIAVSLAPIDARALYTYALDGFGFALGASQTGNATAYSIGASYEAAGFKIAAEYARADWDNAVVASVTATGQIANTATTGNNSFNADGSAIMRSNTLTFVHGARAEDITLGASYTIDNLTLKAVAQRREFTLTTGANIDEHNTYGVSAAYKMDALGVSAFYMQTKSDALNTTADNYGIGASYDLGGGASIVGGIVSAGNFTGGNDTKADLGVSFSF
jgi:hypothetical protein